MIVDYGWIQTILNGSLSFIQYTTGNVQQDTSGAGRIGYVDLKFNTGDLNYPFFVLTDIEDAGNGGNYFTYSSVPNGSFANSITIDVDKIEANGTYRIYVHCADSYTETKHVKAKFVLTPGGQWKPPTWTSSVYGYDLYAVPANALSYRYYDWNGIERGAGDINNYHIGWIDITLNLPFSFPNTSFTITDSEPGSNGGNYFQYSFDNASWADSITWNPGTVQNGSACRVYVRFNDNNSGWRRVTSQLITSGSIAGQARSLTSAVYGANISQGFGIRYYDNTGTERGYLINYYTIGFIDLTLPISDSSPNNTFYISDTEPASNGGNFFQYSFDNANWTNNLVISNVTSARVYVRFIDNQSGARRVTAQLLVSGTNLGQQTSISYGGNISVQPWIQPAKDVITFNMYMDDSGYLLYNMRTGDVTYAINNDTRASSQQVYVLGQLWYPGLIFDGYEDYNNYKSATKNFPAAASPNIASCSGINVRISASTGRGSKAIAQYPNASNDWTIKIMIRDRQDGPGGCSVTINTQVY